MTEDEHIVGYTERKAALGEQVAEAGREALMVFAADKVSKVRELRLENARARRQPAPLARLRVRQFAYYPRCLRLLEESLTHSRLVGELRRELEWAAEESPVAAGSVRPRTARGTA